MTIAYLGDYEAQALGLLLSQYRKPRLSALVKAGAGGCQWFEDMAFDVSTTDNPENASGTTLDRWGRIVGQGRRGLNDDEYGRFISARIDANVSGSDVETLLRLWEMVAGPGEVRWFSLQGAMGLVVWREEPMREVLRERVREFMRAVQPAGMGMTLIEAATRDAAYRYDVGPGLDVGAFARLV